MKKHKIKNHSVTNIEAPDEILRKAVKDCEGKMSKESKFRVRQLVAIEVAGARFPADEIVEIKITGSEVEIAFNEERDEKLTYHSRNKMNVELVFGEVAQNE